MGEQHPRTLSAAQNYGAALWLRGKNQEAVEVLSVCVADTKRVLGRDHSTTVAMLSVLAAALTNVGKHEEALVHRRELYATASAGAGPMDPSVVVARHMLCENLLAAGHCDEGATLFKEIEKSLTVLGDGHMGDSVARLRFELARCRSDLAGMEEGRARLVGTTHEAEIRRAFEEAKRKILPDSGR
jgi:hypothetical protein